MYILPKQQQAERPQVIGEGYHPKAGEPHAEVFALRAAGVHPSVVITNILKACAAFHLQQAHH